MAGSADSSGKVMMIFFALWARLIPSLSRDTRSTYVKCIDSSEEEFVDATWVVRYVAAFLCA
jgi:hypothetical protein